MSNTNASAKHPEIKHPILSKEMLLPFIIVALLFPLWGFANDVTNPLVKAFKDIFLISNVQSSMVQFSFYFGYGLMAIPAAIFIRFYTYKAGILLGLVLYAAGALLFIPASMYQEFYFFLAALCILTCGLALLETTANPYILSMGHEKTATQRLNLAQSFNPIGSLAGMFVASNYILSELKVEEFRISERLANQEYANMLPATVDQKLTESLLQFSIDNPVAHQAMQSADLLTVRGPYVIISIIVGILFFVFLVTKLPKTQSQETKFTLAELAQTTRQLLSNNQYVEGVIAQAFYVGAQIMCWTFIIHYGMTSVGLTASEAQNYNIIAMVIFLCSRFISTFLLGFANPGKLLLWFGVAGIIACFGAIVLPGMWGLYSLISISACMSLMFPTIYGIALKNLGDDASFASAGLVMAIVGGALMPPLQGAFIDVVPTIGTLSSVKTSFILPAICLTVVSIYGYRSAIRSKKRGDL
jgi:FHS family L-fucose permease-like MFS transporter